MDAASRTQLRLPFTIHETRAAKLERLLSGKLAGKVTTAAKFFDANGQREAERIAKEDRTNVR